MSIDDDDDFYAGPDVTLDAYLENKYGYAFIDEQLRIADSYPHDASWAVSARLVEMYRLGHMSRTGAAVS